MPKKRKIELFKWLKLYPTNRLFAIEDAYISKSSKSKMLLLLLLATLLYLSSLVNVGLIPLIIVCSFFITMCYSFLKIEHHHKSIYLLLPQLNDEEIMKSLIIGLKREKNKKVLKHYLELIPTDKLIEPYFESRIANKKLLFELYALLKLKKVYLEDQTVGDKKTKIAEYEEELKDNERDIIAVRSMLDKLTKKKESKEKLLNEMKILKYYEENDLITERIKNNSIEND